MSRGFNSWSVVSVQKTVKRNNSYQGPGILDPEVTHHLQLLAVEMSMRKEEWYKIQNDAPCDGHVMTQYKTCILGAKSGVLFHAHIDSDQGEYQINFLISEKELREAAKQLVEIYKERGIDPGESCGRIPVDELYEFKDLKHLYKKRILN